MRVAVFLLFTPLGTLPCFLQSDVIFCRVYQSGTQSILGCLVHIVHRNLSEYVFTSNSKKLFFDVNLFYGASIAHIWYTASSAADFFAPYRDSDGGMLCFYRPDFVIEMKDGCFYIVEITDGRTANDRIVQAKKRYIEKNNISPNGAYLSYISVPIRLADMPFEDFIRAAP